MPKFGMTHRKPSAWSKRAKPLSRMSELTESEMRSNSPEHLWSDRAFRGLSFAVIAMALVKIVIEVINKMGGSISFGALGDPTNPIIIVLAAVMMGMVVLRFIGRCRLRRRVLDARGFLCPYCAYDLRNLGEDSLKCPECGKFTPRRECVLLWCRFMRSKD